MESLSRGAPIVEQSNGMIIHGMAAFMISSGGRGYQSHAINLKGGVGEYAHNSWSNLWNRNTHLYRSAGIVNSGLYASFMPYFVRNCALSYSVCFDLISSICSSDDNRVLCTLT